MPSENKVMEFDRPLLRVHLPRPVLGTLRVTSPILEWHRWLRSHQCPIDPSELRMKPQGERNALGF